MTPRPSDEARRALRAARERDRQGKRTDGTDPAGPREKTSAPEETPTPATPTPTELHPRPADAARAALRRATRGDAADAGGREAISGGSDGASAVMPGGVGAADTSTPGAGGEPGASTPGAAGAGTSAVGGAAEGGGPALRGPGEAGGFTPGGVGGPGASTQGAAEAGGPAPGAAESGTSTPSGAAGAGTSIPGGDFIAGGPTPSGAARASGPAPGGAAPVSGAGARGAVGSAGARPGDVAREALRAARRDRERGRSERDAAAAKGTASARATRRPVRPVPPVRNESSVARARELRELLAGAFRMPTGADGPEEETSPGRSETARTEAHGDTAADHAAPAPAPPHLPRSMAAPDRDGDLRRTFPAFPARSTEGAAGAAFAETWWGNAWVSALEEGALDAKRLVRGRAYAEQGNVDAITVTPGLVLAYVRGSRPRPYRVQVRLRTLDDADWERFLDAAAERPGHIAALLDKEMPQSLAACGVPLLPGPRDLDPRCSCPDSGHPCKHAAALCYQTARLLDEDPFVLLLLRGRGERELLDALSRLSAARTARAAQEREPEPLPGVRASHALAPRELPPLPQPLPPPPHPEQPPVYPAAPGGPDPFALDQLATDAAARAHALLATGRDPVGELTLWQDAVRLAAARPGSGLTAGSRALYASLASAAGRTPAELARAVAAWRQGGPAGLAVLEEPWDPPAGRFDRARPLLVAADLPAFRPWRNHLTHPRGHVQLRLGRDGLWYAYESEPGHEDWWPRGTPDLDPVGALTGLGGPGEP
ncbi:SWIM zinc finger family protein [Streptomyces sp. CC219B]|uniref:SWIM zinc finger family protein n=1 Tax=Streptomyces sp. CC219B TaxID=3044574 RepID=UPI0024A92741|nr:SWIM zinc finger family protein [Streptomyces sp. CC219B]